jgi:hypothetical protein
MSSSASPDIVTNGLVLCLDAADKKSYPGSGATWFDRSGNGNNGSLVNGPTFSGANSGNIVFDGSDDTVTLGSPSKLTALFGTNAVSVDFWLKRTANITTQQKIIFDSGNSERIQIDCISNQLAFLITTSSSIRSLRSSSLDLDVWYNYVGVYNGSNITTYLNSIQSSQVAQTGNIATDSGGFFIASYTSAGFNFPGRIASVKVYNRALSPQEIKQNFNATKSKFGLL